jgi:hypothetical protein
MEPPWLAMEPPWLAMGEEYNEKVFSVRPHHPSCMVHLVLGALWPWKCATKWTLCPSMCQSLPWEVEPIGKEQAIAVVVSQQILSFFRKKIEKILEFFWGFFCKND